MSTCRALLRSVQSVSAFPIGTSGVNVGVAALQQGSLLTRPCRISVIRASSSWVLPQHRGRRQTVSRRPKVNGKPVAFHVKDLAAVGNDKHFGTTPPATSTKANKSYDSDLIVVLDMDECLIHSQFLLGPGAKYAHQVRRSSADRDNINAQLLSVDTFQITLPDGEEVRVHERPQLREFLEQVSAKYETHIFTAAMEVYAKPVLDRLDPSGTMISKRWYRESCTLDRSVGAYVKDLSNLYDNLSRTVLVDNNPLSFMANPTNGILVSSFYNDPTDTTLPAVWKLLQELETVDDVRPILDARFGLRQALDEIKSGQSSASQISPPPSSRTWQAGYERAKDNVKQTNDTQDLFIAASAGSA